MGSASKGHKVSRGSGNVFDDLGYRDAAERSLKVRLAMEVNRVLAEQELSKAAAAKALGIAQPRLSDLVNYRLNRFSMERLMALLTLLGQDVEVRIKPRTAESRSGTRRPRVP